MLVYLAADEDRMTELDSAVRDYLGWSDVLAKQDELDLTQNQKNQATEKQKQANATVNSRLLGAYQWALVPEQPDAAAPFVLKAIKAEGQATSLAERVSKRLGNDGALSTQQAAAAIRHVLNGPVKALWASGHVAVGDLWKVYTAYPYMPRLRDRSVLNIGLVSAPLLWEQDGFALADGYDEAAGRYRGLVLPSDKTTIAITDATLIVMPAAATAQRAAETVEAPAPTPGDEDAPPPTYVPLPGQPGVYVPAPPLGKKRFFGTKELSPDRYAMDFKKITDEVLAHLASTPGVHLKVRIEIEATVATGFDEAQVRTVSENAQTLKFEQSGFEES
jgi:hypothetical protein